MMKKRALVAALTAASIGLAAAAPAGANVQVGSSGWEWGNPLPQGNTLRATSFAGSTGYAVGDFGTLLKTADGGTTWSGLQVGTFSGLSLVQAIDANTVFAGGGCVARRSTDGGESFNAIAFTPVESSCRSSLKAMSFVSATLGFLLLEDGSVFATDDGGTQFAQRTALPGTSATGGNATPTALAFTSPTTGFAATAAGTVFGTTDAGVSWRIVSELAQPVATLTFLDAANGFAIGGGGLFATTGDGGRTWTPRDLGAGALAYTGIGCATTQLCVLSTSTGAQLVRTADAGRTPGAVITPSSDPIFTAAFASPTRIAAAGANGSTVISDDAGATFSPIGGRLSGSYSAIVAGGTARTAYAPGAVGALAKTTDGGRSWSRGNVPTPGDLIDVSFPKTTVGYALDDAGGLFRTATGGATWKTLGTGSASAASAVYAPNAATVLAIGPRGVRRSTDEGESFSQVRAKAVLGTQLRGVTAGRGAIFAWGPTTVARSTDSGRTWTALTKPGATRRARKRLGIQRVAFSSASTGLLLDSAGRLWRTATSGASWTVLTGVGTDRVRGMATTSGRSAYLVIDRFGGTKGGYLLRTTDAGATWQPQFVVSSQIVSDGIATGGGGIDYLLAGSSGLLSSRSGGSAGKRSRLTLATRRGTLTRAAAITVTGRLSPAGRSARVTISSLPPGSSSWRTQTVDVVSNGSFASRWRVAKGTTQFVAQWAGDFQLAGAGSPTLSVTVKPPPRRAGSRRGTRR